MPPVNHVVLASGAVVAVSVAVATAIAIYESPELRRYADDVRRRIAIALHSMGEGINPPQREPLFNRPEDAEGFLQSRAGAGAEPGVDADDETRRRQREELLYWNSLRVQKQDKEATDEAAGEKEASGERPTPTKRGSSFDDFLEKDKEAGEGTYVFNTGADARGEQSGLRHRGDAPRGFATSLYANPFADEHHIGNDEMDEAAANIAPGKDEVMSDIYSATTRDPEDRQAATLEPSIAALEPSAALIDLTPEPSHTESSATVDRELQDDEYMTAGQEDHQEAYASIQAWAQNSSRDFYSPLPVTPAEPVSEPELISDGELTPTDSMSLAGSGEDVANDAQSSRDGETGRYYDVMSESDGMATPASWSEVGSVVSENDGPAPVHA